MVSESIVAMMKEYRKNKGWSQFAFGDKLVVSERTIRRYESGAKYPTLEVIERFAKMVGKSLPELLKVEENEEGRRKRQFLDDVWDVHLKYFLQDK